MGEAILPERERRRETIPGRRMHALSVDDDRRHLRRDGLKVRIKITSPPRGTRRIGGSNLFKTGFFLRVPRVLRGGDVNSATRSNLSRLSKLRTAAAQRPHQTPLSAPAPRRSGLRGS